ncbi:integrase [Acetobacterium sp.]|uniref:integrase n=1 Tax=Acetobacterium sp. TaxID=1872094 RepID=UPI0035931BB1
MPNKRKGPRHVDEQICKLKEYDGRLTKHLIADVTVFDEKLAVEFKTREEIEIIEVA